MKIAIDIRNIGKGRTGDEVVFFELVKHLAIIDKENQYKLLIDKRAEVEIKKITEDLGIGEKSNFVIVQLNSGNKFIWNGWKMAEYCAQEKIDIYHTQYIIPFFLPTSTKIITHIHDVSFKVHKELISKKDAFFLNHLIPRAIRESDKIIAVSQFTKDEIIKYYDADEQKIEVVHNAVSVVTSNKDFVQLKQKYNLPEAYILAIGTMQPRKNIPFLIKSFAQLNKQQKDINLVLVGKKAHNFDTTITQVIEQFPEIKEKIIFTGYVEEEDKFEIFKNAKLFVSPSLYEGFGVPILESFEADTLAVVSDIEPYREVGGEGAIYFDPYIVDQCAKTLYDCLVNDKMKELVLEKAKLQKSKFSWLESSKKLKSIYEEV